MHLAIQSFVKIVITKHKIIKLSGQFLFTFHSIAAAWLQDLPDPATHEHPAVCTSPDVETKTQAQVMSYFKALTQLDVCFQVHKAVSHLF